MEFESLIYPEGSILKKGLFITLGFLALLLGLIGVVVPVLPTTPFIILSAFLFSKGSPKLQAWVSSLPIAGPAVTNWQEHRVISMKAKQVSISMILIFILPCVFWLPMPHWSLRVLLVIIAALVIRFISTQKSSI